MASEQVLKETLPHKEDGKGSAWPAHATRFVFLALGLVISAWAMLVPYAKARLGVDEAVLGLLLLLVGTGAIISMPFAGWLTGRFGCRRVLITASLIFISCLAALAWVPFIWGFALALFILGLTCGTADVGINIQAVMIEEDQGRRMMSGFHGMYSIGGVIGGFIMSFLLKTGLSPAQASACFCIVLAALLAGVFGRHLYPYGSEKKSGPIFVMPKGQILLLGSLCFILYMMEGIVLDWGGLFMVEGKGIPPETAGLSFAVFSAATSTGRFLGDRLIEWLGIRKIMVFSSIVVAAGFACVIFAPGALTAFAAFAIIGFGISNTIPVLFSVSAHQKIMPANLAISVVTTLGYTGLLAGPPVMGLIAHSFSLQSVFLAAIGLMVLVLAASFKIRVH